jgi:hypothetical protein
MSRLLGGVPVGMFYGWIVGLSLSLPSGGSGSRRFGGLQGLNLILVYGLIVGVIGGLICGLGVSSLGRILSVETISWKWNPFWKRAILGSILGLSFAPIFGLIGGQSIELGYGLHLRISRRVSQWFGWRIPR